MALDISCLVCGEDDDLSGVGGDTEITVTSGGCGYVWSRSLVRKCATCGRTDLVAVPKALLERSRGTQLSVVGIQMVELCPACDRDDIERWQKNLPRPLMPTDLPTIGRIDPDAVGG